MRNIRCEYMTPNKVKGKVYRTVFRPVASNIVMGVNVEHLRYHTSTRWVWPRVHAAQIGDKMRVSRWFIMYNMENQMFLMGNVIN